MTEKEIQKVVEEVIRRIHLRKEQKKILVVVNSSADACAVDHYLLQMNCDCGVTKRYVNGGKDSDGLESCDLQSLMLEHCALILSGVTLKQLFRISEMELEEPVAEITAEALRMGKPVTVLSEWIDTSCSKPAFERKISDIKRNLISYGLTFADGKKIKKDKETDIENKAENCRSYRQRIDKRVIAKQDLKAVLGGELEIREDAVMTTTAKDLLEKRKIKIIRY